MVKKIKTSKHTKIAKKISWVWIVLPVLVLGLILFFFLSQTKPCANEISCISDLSGSFTPDQGVGEYMGQNITSPTTFSDVASTQILGDSITGDSQNKRIEIDLTNQKIYAFEENKLIYEFPISSGLWGKTPTGDFRIWIKLRYTRMVGGNKAMGTYYNLPNVPYTMFFYNDEVPKSQGFGIHGAYWHNNFGHPMSHGCINMREEDVAKIYNWAGPTTQANTTYATDENPGTPIKIYGEPTE